MNGKLQTDKGSRKTILLVDDSRLLRDVYSQALKSEGFLVLQAKDAAMAEEIVRSDVKIDLLLTDFQMPGRNGVELAQWFQQVRPGVPILLVSASASHVDFAAAALPAIVCDEKPSRLDDLTKLVLRVLSRCD